MGAQRRVTGPGGVAFRTCPTCHRPVLSAFRGEVTAVGKGEIQSVTREGSIIGKCECGKRVVWEREPTRAR